MTGVCVDGFDDPDRGDVRLVQIPYQTVEVNPISKSQLKWSKYKKVPVVMLDSETTGDSSAIISHLQAALEHKRAEQHPPPKKGWLSLFGGANAPAEAPSEPQTEEEKKWRKWVDDRLVKVQLLELPSQWVQTGMGFVMCAQLPGFVGTAV